MPSKLIKNAFANTYKDDYRDSDNYYRILFNSGRALQSRELTQMQTIQSKELERFARYIFIEGALISGGSKTFNPLVYFVKLKSTPALPDLYEDLVGKTVTNQLGIKARIRAVIPAVDSDPNTLMLEYIDSNNVEDADTTKTAIFKSNDTLTTSLGSLVVQQTNTVANRATGKGCLISVPSSTYFVQGHFVYVAPQTLVVSKYSNTPTTTIGFKVDENIITVADEIALYDNQGANPNLTSPGADRYQITLTLINQDDIVAGETFIPAFRVVNGAATPIINPKNDKEIVRFNNILAQRTKEESGSYVVNGFNLRIKDNDSDNTNVDMIVSPGVAYNQGIRVQNTAPTVGDLFVSKPRTSGTIQNQAIAANYGNYLLAADLKGLISNVGTYAKVNLRDSADYLGTTIGTARIRAVDKVSGSSYRLHVFDINMDSNGFGNGINIGTIKSIGTSSTNYATINRDAGVTELFNQAENDMFFALPRARARDITDVVLTTQRILTGTTDGSGNVTITLASGETYADEDEWVLVVDSSGETQTVSVSSGGAGSQSVTLQSLPTSSAITLAAYAAKTATSKTKTLTTVTSATLTPETDGDVVLNRADVYSLTSVIDSTTSEDITYKYQLDNGQKDNYYDVASLRLLSGYVKPSGNVSVSYKYFAHGASGDFFSVKSYTGAIDYTLIPSYRLNNGTFIDIADVLDFRSVKDTTGANFTGTGSTRFKLPRNRDTITADVNYYRGKKVIVYIGPKGNLKVAEGSSSFIPKDPAVPAGSMILYNVTFAPYLVNLTTDITIEKINNKAYKMSDIRDLEDRIFKLEEFATLSLLEQETATLSVVDENGLARTKLGLTADNFKTQSGALLSSREYRAAIDPVLGTLLPQQTRHELHLAYNPDLSVGTTRIGDWVMPSYTDTLLINQPVASTPINVNQFTLSKFNGDLILSPSSDTWTETVVTASGNDPKTATVYNKEGDQSIYDQATSMGWTPELGDYTYNVGNKTYRIKGSTAIKQSTERNLVGKSAIKYCRNKFIFFKASGLRPNTRHFVFFDNIDISNWVQAGEGLYQDYGSLADDSPYGHVGDRYDAATQFPVRLGGKTAKIFSDDAGDIEGIIYIQSNDTVKYTTGAHKISLIDVSDYKSTDKISTCEQNWVAEGKLRNVETTEINTSVVTYGVSVSTSSGTTGNADKDDFKDNNLNGIDDKEDRANDRDNRAAASASSGRVGVDGLW